MRKACQPFCRKTISLALAVSLFGTVVVAQQTSPMQRRPLARLVRTPNASTDVPPYALADQSGAIQRYVEPIDGIDLESHVGQIVSVRHDTGETLLASQLVLPESGLYPMLGDDRGAEPTVAGRLAQLVNGTPRTDYSVRQSAFVDNDDSTVELIPDEGPVPESSVLVPSGTIPAGAIYPDGTPVYPAPMAAGMPMGAGPMYCDPTTGCYPGDYGMGAPYGGGYPAGPVMDPNMGFVQPLGQPAQQSPQDRPHFYGELEINFLRAHIPESSSGKLSEKYEFSPRFILGFTDVANLSGRVRYWVYGRGTNGLNADDSLHLDFDVWDIEATHRFVGRKTEVQLAAGMRLAKIEIDDSEGDSCGTDLIGLTMAADGWTPVFNCSQGCFGWVYGGRLSILAGDWGGDIDNDIINARIRDDNVVVHELYAGVGYTRCCRGMDMNARLGFEMQNWHSDVLSSATFGDSIGFVGPGVEIGVQF